LIETYASCQVQRLQYAALIANESKSMVVWVGSWPQLKTSPTPTSATASAIVAVNNMLRVDSVEKSDENDYPAKAVALALLAFVVGGSGLIAFSIFLGLFLATELKGWLALCLPSFGIAVAGIAFILWNQPKT